MRVVAYESGRNINNGGTYWIENLKRRYETGNDVCTTCLRSDTTELKQYYSAITDRIVRPRVLALVCVWR